MVLYGACSSGGVRLPLTAVVDPGAANEYKWGRCVFWAKCWYAWPAFRDFERGYKDEIVANIELAHRAVRSNTPDWTGLLHRALDDQTT
jgi:hypothetical protein